MTTDASVHAELDGLLLPWDDVSTRGMFGGRGYFVGDRLFAAYYKGVVAKLPDPDREEALSRKIARPFTPTAGRRFGNWVKFPVQDPDGVEALLPWLRKAFEYVQATPPKGRHR
jgi:TfoX/Sxy family transcriptional regulator of competence genes